MLHGGEAKETENNYPNTQRYRASEAACADQKYRVMLLKLSHSGASPFTRNSALILLEFHFFGPPLTQDSDLIVLVLLTSSLGDFERHVEGKHHIAFC